MVLSWTYVVVREGRIGMVKIGDEHQPMSSPRVRNEIGSEHCQETPDADGIRDSGEPDRYADAGHDDLSGLVRFEDGAAGQEIYKRPRVLVLMCFRLERASGLTVCPGGIVPLAFNVRDEVRPPTNQLQRGGDQLMSLKKHSRASDLLVDRPG